MNQVFMYLNQKITADGFLVMKHNSIGHKHYQKDGDNQKRYIFLIQLFKIKYI